jgi:hypothetical protein
MRKLLFFQKNKGTFWSDLKLEMCGGCHRRCIRISPRIEYGAGLSGTGYAFEQPERRIILW